MAIDFSQLKKNKQQNFEKLVADIEKIKKGSSFKADEREWRPTVDAAGNGFAIIRFLPAHKEEETPFQYYYRYAFRGPGGWYIENSPTTFKESDPMADYNTKMWNSGSDEDKKIVRTRSRKLTYIANIFVVKDAANPEAEGRNFFFKFGKRIFEKLEAASFPPEEIKDQAFDPFDLWDGANFQLVIRKEDGQRNYNQSKFSAQGPLFKDEKKMKAVYDAEYPLLPFVARDQFKTVEQLKVSMNRALCLNEPVSAELARGPVSGPASNPDEGSTLEPSDDKEAEYFAKLAEE
jgi:hypothetical protein